MVKAKEQVISSSSVSEILQEDRSLYSSQFALGFRSLSFIPELEPDFRQFYLENNPGQIRRVLPVALLITLLFIVTDHLRLPADVVSALWKYRAVQLGSLAALTLIVYRGKQSLIEAGVILTLLAYGCSTPIILGTINVSGEFSPISAHLMILAFCYLLSGLRFYRAALTGLVISLAYPTSQLLFIAPLPNLAFNCFMVLAFNVMGLCGAYFLEYTGRENFLGRQLLGKLALFDGLTGLLNRRAFSLDLEKICSQAKRDQVELAIAMVDVDHFKEFNDYFGHVQGDQCLRNIASALREAAKRPLDKIGRYGGEEFVIAWYDCADPSARTLGEMARTAVEDLLIPHGPGASQRFVSVSIGIATTRPGEFNDSSTLIRAADRALYEAKAYGRNKVVTATDNSFSPRPLR